MNIESSISSSVTLPIASTTEQAAALLSDTASGLAQQEVEAKLSLLTSEIDHMYEHVPFASHTSDIDDVYQQINSLELAWLGCTREEVIGKKKLTDFLTPDSRLKFNAHFPSFVKSRFVVNLELDLLSQDGTIKPISLSSSDFMGADGKCVKHRSVLFDLTERKQNEEKQRIAAIAFESLSGMLITDSKGVIEQLNRAFTRLTGYSNQDALGKTPRLLSSGRHDKAFYRAMWASLKENGSWQGEIWNRRKNGEVYAEWLEIVAVHDANGAVTHYVGSFFDLTESKEAQAEINRLVYFDPLTQLPNRRMLQDRIAHALAASNRGAYYGAILFIDLDNFKSINDTRGHDYGDLLLIEVGKRLRSAVREGDSVARLGGDEFVVLLEGLGVNAVEAAIQAKLVGEKILGILAQSYNISGYEFNCTASIGLSMYGAGETAADMLQHADIAMYQSKKAGRNALRFFDPNMQALVIARVALEEDLHRALEKNQFELYYQAQVNQQRQVIGAEALLRWRHPARGLVSPLEFIPLAEETGLILPIGLWVLKTACAQLKAWEGNAHTRGLQLSVNVSARQFRQADFVALVRQALDQYNINPKLLKLELTESIVLDVVADAIAKMNALGENGVRFSMDDFGTGFSSLAYLIKLPLAQLKIDQSFVGNIGIKPADAIIVKIIIDMASSLGMEVIAEGVETEAQRDFLGAHDCHLYQGYLFSKPLPIEAFEVLLKQS